MDPEAHYRKLERMYLSAPVQALYPGTSLLVDEGRSLITMTVRQQHLHAAKGVHGSVYFRLLDDAAFFAANSLVKNVFVLTVNFQIQLLRPVSKGILRATGKVQSTTRQMIAARSELFDDRDRLLAAGSGLFMRSKIPLSPEIGYGTQD